MCDLLPTAIKFNRKKTPKVLKPIGVSQNITQKNKDMKRLIFVIILLFGISKVIVSQEEEDKKRISFSGKALFRLTEFDWKQKRIDENNGNTYYDGDRHWSRYNFYLNVNVHLNNQLSLKSQIRTGNKQYAFVTFGANKDERFNIILSELYLKWDNKFASIKLGRQGAGSIWKNQKGAQFDIPTHDGISISKEFSLGNLTLLPQLAFFDEKYRNNTGYEKHGKMYGGSVLLKNKSEAIDWHLQTGLLFADHLPNRYENDIAENDAKGVRYHDGDLAADYKLWVSQLKVALPQAVNLTCAVDFYRNFNDYDATTQTHLIKSHPSNPTPNFTKENTGIVATLSAGDFGKSKSLYGGVSYLYVEKYAAMDYFAQYDYCRWASSNIKGIEIFAGYRFNKYVAFKTRFFSTEDIKGYYAINPDSKRSTYRIRFDLSISF